jgi:hypothetical protein
METDIKNKFMIINRQICTLCGTILHIGLSKILDYMSGRPEVFDLIGGCHRCRHRTNIE